MVEAPKNKTTSFDLDRFVVAQAPVYKAVLDELRAGEKHSHWMWFIFPQLRGLGCSPTALKYGIENLEEARAYLEHPVLGPRLIECTEATLRAQDRTLHQIFGSPDDLKFRSSMTLFCEAVGAETVFRQALDRYCDGQKDPATLNLLEG
jgi:uncharacterized protein (DUF1810 family)